MRLTDELGVTVAFVPHIAGLPDPCFNAFSALGPGGHRLLVDASDPSRHACGDGPGRGTYAGMVVDTKTGEKRELADETPLRSGVFLPDGRLLAQTSAGDLVLLGDRGQLLARTRDPVLGPDSHVLAYVPG